MCVFGQQPMNCLSVFNYFVGLTLKELNLQERLTLVFIPRLAHTFPRISEVRISGRKLDKIDCILFNVIVYQFIITIKS